MAIIGYLPRQTVHSSAGGKFFPELNIYLKKFALADRKAKKGSDYRKDDFEPLHDNAMAVNNTGGIDFTTNKTPLEIQNAGKGIKFHLDPVQLQQFQNAPGFIPVIINIQPMTDLRTFLGVPSEVSK